MGKLQVFHETRYGFKATLRYLGPDAWPEEYRLIIYGFGGKEFYRRDYCTAAEAKEVLDTSAGFWHTVRGYVSDYGETV